MREWYSSRRAHGEKGVYRSSPMVSLLPRRFCTIFSVAHKQDCRWKWRSYAADGQEDTCPEEYDAVLRAPQPAAASASGRLPSGIGPLRPGPPTRSRGMDWGGGAPEAGPPPPTPV